MKLLLNEKLQLTNVEQLMISPSEDPLDGYKYEVAISLRNEDVREAQELHDLLQPRVKSIFFFPESQRELVGQDGVEKFGSVFRSESRIVVVFYREGWGKTPWTKVEEIAIKEMCLNLGWNRIMVHSTDGTVPSWLPTIYIWSGSRYGLSALAGSIEQKVKEVGGQVGEEDPITKAQRLQRWRAAVEAREARRGTVEAVNAARKERKEVETRLAELVSAPALAQAGFQGGEVDGRYIVRVDNSVLFFRWTGQTVNSIRGDKFILTRGTWGVWGIQKNDQRTLATYELELAEDDTTWRWVDNKGLYFSSSEVANTALSLLLDEYERRTKAALERRRRS